MYIVTLGFNLSPIYTHFMSLCNNIIIATIITTITNIISHTEIPLLLKDIIAYKLVLAHGDFSSLAMASHASVLVILVPWF